MMREKLCLLSSLYFPQPFLGLRGGVSPSLLVEAPLPLLTVGVSPLRLGLLSWFPSSAPPPPSLHGHSLNRPPHHRSTLLHSHHSSPKLPFVVSTPSSKAVSYLGFLGRETLTGCVLLPPPTSSQAPTKKPVIQAAAPSSVRRPPPKPPPLASLQLYWKGSVSPSGQLPTPRQAVGVPPPSEKFFLRPPRKPPDAGINRLMVWAVVEATAFVLHLCCFLLPLKLLDKMPLPKTRDWNDTECVFPFLVDPILILLSTWQLDISRWLYLINTRDTYSRTVPLLVKETILNWIGKKTVISLDFNHIFCQMFEWIILNGDWLDAQLVVSHLDGVDFLPNGRPFGGALELATSIVRGRISIDSVHRRDTSLCWTNPDVGLERGNMQPRTSIGDGFRISVSSTPSCSSGGSGPDDIESLGDVYIWGEVWADGVAPDGSSTQIPTTTDVLVPKPLESSVVLDVQQIASGVRHMALVTRQGEVFTWGEESGGRLGHGIDKDFGRPQLVEFLAVTNVETVACGENHTCAVSISDDLFSWGDGTYNVGLLGHGTDVSHWIPKRVSGSLEGLQVISIACGTWHSALATSNGKLFTFGDGTFGVLGHGSRESVAYPKEVQLLSGLKTIKVACGVWHTAAIVEVTFQSGSHVSSRKLFTWGDGDKYRLGHGNKETYLQPTCVSTLIEYNFHQIACGHAMTVALTTSGHVFTMGGTDNGQLGNALSDGKMPMLVQDKLVGEFVEEISCGSHHVAALTSRSELYTWGKGANGRLGHGDIEDRKYPVLVESLKERHVKNISCGSSFTSCICIHKWVSGVDQSACTGCRQPFGFTRKRHNCYNCGLVHCHGCSSRKILKAALAPTPGKPHRVCDSCHAKLKAVEINTASTLSRRVTTGPRVSMDGRERFGQGEIRSTKILFPPFSEPLKLFEMRNNKIGGKYDYSSMLPAPQVSSLTQLKDISFPSSTSSIPNSMNMRPTPSPTPPSTPPLNSRSPSPYARRPSPPRSGTPGFSRSLIDSLKKTNELLNQEVSKLQNQNRSLRQKSNMEIQKLQKNVKEATSLASRESSKQRAATEFFESMIVQLKEMAEELPPEVSDIEKFRNILTQGENFLKEKSTTEQQNAPASNNGSHRDPKHRIEENNEAAESNGSSISNSTEAAGPSQSTTKEPTSLTPSRSEREGEPELIEPFEPGVYVTVTVKPGGIKIFKGVRFSRRRFHEQQAEEWWNKNRDRVIWRYSERASNEMPTTSTTSEQNIEATTAPDRREKREYVLHFSVN